MKKERLDVIKSILIVLILTFTTILVCVKFMYHEYLYTIKYYDEDNLYTIKITEDYKIDVDVELLCTNERCKNKYKSPISVNIDTDKTKIKKLIELFNPPQNGILVTEEKTITEEQRDILIEIIG